ncbi:MAG: hypothetical protein MMC23_003895 [Stictis urceolatum]|nr:hypothetical protein [Stictis urceolata]
MPQPMYRETEPGSGQGAASEAADKLTDCAQSKQAEDDVSREGAVQGAGSHTGAAPMAQNEADRLYEERMEEEYAKREGGA